MSNLQLRVISAVVLAIVVLLVTWAGGLPFRILSAAIALLMFYEWSRMSRPLAGKHWQGGSLGFLPEILLVVFCAVLVLDRFPFSPLLFAAALLAVLAVTAAVRGGGRWEVSGFAYCALSALSLAGLRDGDTQGLLAVLYLFAVVWATDIMAYFVGRAVGGPKLAPSISPGKTRSGALGGALGAIAAALLFALAAGTGRFALLAGIAIVLSIVSQAGDLFESWVKRRHGVKDSGRIIPGHGGVLDRVDGLVVAAFALYLIGSMLGGVDDPASGLFPL
jgi:phosphatidate cytidylyltransferase